MVVDTKLSIKEAINRAHNIVEELNGKIKKHQYDDVFSRVGDEYEILDTLDRLKLVLSKFEMGFLKLILSNANYIAQMGQKNPSYHQHIDNSLDKIGELLKATKKGEIYEIRKSRYLGRTAHHMNNRVRRIKREVDSFHRKTIAKQRNVQIIKK